MESTESGFGVNNGLDCGAFGVFEFRGVGRLWNVN